MPIAPIVLQRRLREVGRIRIGEKKVSAKGKTYPAKLSTFRFTSRDEQIIRRVAELLGGTPEPWEAEGQWQVATPSSSIEVVLPPPDVAFSQYLELWSAGGCLRRCDGVRELLKDTDCICDADARECKPHTRLSVMLPDLPGIGLWRIDTGGFNAAAELQGAIELARTYGAPYLPARLRVEVRKDKKDGKTREYPVPVLDLDVPLRAFAALASADRSTGEIGPGFKPVPELPPGPQTSVLEQLTEVGKEEKPKRRGSAPALPRTGLKPRGMKVSAGEATAPSAAASRSEPDAGMSTAVRTPPAPAEQPTLVDPNDLLTPEMITPEQRTKLHAATPKAWSRTGRLQVVGDMIGRRIASYNDLTKQEASRAIEAMEYEQGGTDHAARSEVLRKAPAQEGGDTGEGLRVLDDHPGRAEGEDPRDDARAGLVHSEDRAEDPDHALTGVQIAEQYGIPKGKLVRLARERDPKVTSINEVTGELAAAVAADLQRGSA